MKRLLLFSFGIWLINCLSAQVVQRYEAPQRSPKNIIVLISDGCGYNQIKAANYYSLGADGKQVYENWPVEYAMSTYHSKADYIEGVKSAVNELSDFSAGYQSDSAYSSVDYLAKRPTDSAAAGTAMACGKKSATYAIGVDIFGNVLPNLCERAIELDKSAGVVTSVQFAHATPAAFVAHNISRKNYSEIALEMLGSDLSVIMGCGHPEFDDNGIPQVPNEADGDYKMVGGKSQWEALKAGTTPWSLVEDKSDFEAIASGVVAAPQKILGVPKVNSTLQAKRSSVGGEQPFGAMNSTVPSLELMTRAALQNLGGDVDGFFLMVEGGAVDWAGHDNDLGRVIEEEVDFNAAVDAVVAWVESNSSWNETMVIVTGDHETGYLTGPDYGNDEAMLTEDFPVVFTNVGTLPDAKFNLDKHTNQLIPFFAKGVGSEVFGLFTNRQDFFRGDYIDNTDVANGCFKLWEDNLSAPIARNVFLFISDGMGYNHMKAADLWSGSTPDYQLWHSFPMSTYNTKSDYVAGESGAVDQLADYGLSYHSYQAWSDIDFVSSKATDSGAAGTAMATGVKTAKYAVGTDKDGNPLQNLCEKALECGKLSGVVSSVQFSHATPASFGSHNAFRNNYSEIALDMLSSRLAVIMGCGNPDYDNDGQPETGAKQYKYIGGSETVWEALKTGESILAPGVEVSDIDLDGASDAWHLIETVSDFEALTTGTTPLRVLGVPRVHKTLQQKRSYMAGDDNKGKDEVAFSVPFNQQVPTLAKMTRGAINVLDNSNNGFFLMVEGGAIDWAGHANQLGRLIEEQTDFNNAVQEAIDWVNINSNWSESLIIVTADHETGYLVGPNYGDDTSTLFSDYPIVDQGVNVMPQAQFLTGGHTNQLVPLFAKGEGASLFNERATHTDFFRQGYVDNTDVADVVFSMWGNLPEIPLSLNMPQISVGLSPVENVSSQLFVSPNPAGDFCFVKADLGDLIEIISVDGHVVLSQKVLQPNPQLDISFLNSGLYMVRKTYNQIVTTCKLLKE